MVCQALGRYSRVCCLRYLLFWIVTLPNLPLRTAYLSLFFVIPYFWRTTHDRIHRKVTNVCSESRSAILCDGDVAMLLVGSRYNSMFCETGSGLAEYS